MASFSLLGHVFPESTLIISGWFWRGFFFFILKNLVWMSLEHNLHLMEHFSRIYGTQVEEVDIFTSVMTSICHMIRPTSAWTPTIFPHLTPFAGAFICVWCLPTYKRGPPRGLFVLMTFLESLRQLKTDTCFIDKQ